MSDSMFHLGGKRVLVTGASRGIGESVARLLAEHGAHVIVSSRKAEGCESVASSITDAGGKATPMACHMGDAEAVDALFQRIGDELGGLDVLVNNAATNPQFGPLLDTDMQAFDKTVEVNLRGYFYASKRAGEMMRDAGGGNIVNIASINGMRPAPNQGVYSITKGAVITMTDAFAKECAEHNIRVNAVLPGLTDTKFASALTQNEAILKQILPLIPMHRVAQPDEIAPAVLFLASDAARYITGVALPVDGGFLT